MKDDGRTLPEIHEMTAEDAAIAAIRIEELLAQVPQVTAAQYGELFELMRGGHS